MRLLSGIALAVIMSSAATASTVYHWEGNCTLGCAGTASADLTLAAGSPLSFDLNYFPTHDVSDFISFQYTSSSGTFFLDNTSPYLYAQGINNGLLLEENGQGPNTLPLWQFSFNLALADPRGWQFLFGSYFYECLDAQCATWTNDVIRNVGVGGIFTEIQAAAVPGPIAGAGLPGLVMALGGLIVLATSPGWSLHRFLRPSVQNRKLPDRLWAVFLPARYPRTTRSSQRPLVKADEIYMEPII